MGEAKRRKALDPNYGKLEPIDFVKQGQMVFGDQILNDYSRYRTEAMKFFASEYKDLKHLQNDDFNDEDCEIVQSFKVASKVLNRGKDLLLPTIDKFMDELSEGLRCEFAIFVNYTLGTDGGIQIIKGCRERTKRLFTGKDLIILFPFLFVAAIKPEISFWELQQIPNFPLKHLYRI